MHFFGIANNSFYIELNLLPVNYFVGAIIA